MDILSVKAGSHDLPGGRRGAGADLRVVRRESKEISLLAGKMEVMVDCGMFSVDLGVLEISSGGRRKAWRGRMVCMAVV